MDSTTSLLREILMSGLACTQADIRLALYDKGIECSQPKVSRLLNQLGAVKVVDEKGKTHYRLPHDVGLLHELSAIKENPYMKQWVLSIENNNSIIVIHTSPGAAGMLARILDQHRLQLGLLGTIAGDDTIFISPKDLKNIAKTQKEIASLLKL